MSEASSNFTNRETVELDYETIMKRLRTLIRADSEIELARALGLSSSGLANQKRRGIVPWDRVVELAVSRNMSLDELVFREMHAVREQQQGYVRRVVEAEPIDPVLSDIQAWIRAWWVKATGEERIWFQVQLNRCFPERVAWGK